MIKPHIRKLGGIWRVDVSADDHRAHVTRHTFREVVDWLVQRGWLVQR